MSLAKPAGTYRVLHTADWHLGKLLGDHSREEEHARFLEFLLGTILDGEVDVLVVAGDIFDSANPPQSALGQYYDFLARLYSASACSVVIVAGNHDSPGQLESPQDVLKTLRTTIVGRVQDDPIVMLPDRESARLAVAAIPFLRDRDLRSGQMGEGADAIRGALVAGIAERYADAGARVADLGVPALATGHLTVLGSAAADSERDIHVGGLGAVGAKMFPEEFDYVALGHLHRPQACGGNEIVRYSGSPIPLSFSEAGDRKEIRLLDFDQAGLVGQQAIEIPLARRLVQLRVRRAELEEALAKVEPGAGGLRTWVEAVIEGPVSGEDLLGTIKDLTAGQEFDVVRVMCESRRSIPGISSGESAEGQEDLLGDPLKVFSLRLDREPGLEDGERRELQMAFQEVWNRLQEAEDGEG
ncbi:MAG: exonuclease subunit SbcD [Verrucomicrobiales bacterium]